MGNKMKHFLSIVLAFIMVFSNSIPTLANTQTDVSTEFNLPTATVTELQNEELTFALNFKADEATNEQLALYGDWYADFVLTVNKKVTFNADGTADGYLSGQYDAWSENWVSVPFEDVTLEAGTSLKIMEYAAGLMGEPGLKYTYKEVYETVKDFDCGVYFSTDFLLANPDLEVALELKMYNPENDAQSYGIGDIYVFTCPIARNERTQKVYNDISEALFDAEKDDTVLLLRDVATGIVSVPEKICLDLGGNELDATYITCFGDIVDSGEDKSGVLKVDSKRFMIRQGNEQLPVKSQEGYRFFEVTEIKQALMENGTKYAFLPYLDEELHEVLLAGQDTTGVTINVRLSWTQGEDGVRSQDFFYNDELVDNVIQSYDTATGNYSQMFTLTVTGTEGLENLTFEAAVVSNTGVEIGSGALAVDPKNETGNVTTNDKNEVVNEVQIDNAQATAVVAEGTKLAENTTQLILTAEEMDATTSNVTMGDGEQMLSLNVHVEGVAADNTVPVIITLNEVAPISLNQGNIKLYHVENGTTVPMTRVYTLEEVDAHNEFYYDIETGTITVALATFSEVAVVADTINAWNGNIDTTWYAVNTSAARTADADYVIANADQLAGFGQIVGGMAVDDSGNSIQDNFAGKTVKLVSNINLGDKDNENENLIFHPIGYYYTDDKNEDGTAGDYYSTVNSFEGTFDGNGHTISNFYQNTWEIKGDYEGNYYNDAMGLFGYVVNGTVKNLTVDNFSSDGEFTTTGVITAYAVNSTFENIAITNCNPRVYNTGNGGIVGIGGNSNDTEESKLTFTNITIDNTNKISALWGSWDVACGGLVGMFRGAGHAYMTNCHVAAQMDVFNDVCGNYQYYWYRYAGMMIGTNKNMITDDKGNTVPETIKFHAQNCTVHFGEWNNYYYCELVANSLASYTHDHQFSRLEQIDAIDIVNKTITIDGESTAIPTSGKYNYVIVNGEAATENATCYHFVDGEQWKHESAGTETVDGVEGVLKEDKQHIYLPFNQLFTGYGWGVKHIPVYNGEDYAFEGITILDREVADSVVKFESKFTGDFLYRVGNQNTVSIGSLFAKKDDIEVNDSGVWVTIEKIDEAMNVSGTFTADTDDWTKGTIKFEGTGVVKVTIQDYEYCEPTELYLEVVDAYNRTAASFGGNSVLLNDVYTSSTLSTSGVIYGNGFTVNMENAPISEKNGAVFHLYDGAILKNLNIVGKEFTTVAMNVNNTDYGVSAVRAWGTVTIENCYISGCRSALSVTGTELTIKDSVIANGIYANVDFRSGILNLHNVTTINEPHNVGEKTVLGLGIVGNMTASAGRQINITGNLIQYNWVSQEDCTNIKTSGVSDIFNSVFTEGKYSSLRYTYNSTNYVNTGILSLCDDFGKSAVSGNPSYYSGMDVTATISGVTVNGYVWAPAQAGSLTSDDMKYHGVIIEPSEGNQGTSYIPPAFNFANTGLEVENNVLQISYESGSSYTLSNEILKSLITAEKYDQSLNYTIKMEGADYTNSDITFNDVASKTYTITYTITDNLVFDKNGNITDTTYEVTKELKVFASVVDKGADAPTFTFYYGTNGSASAGTPHSTQPKNSYTSTIKQVGEAYYIMPNVSATTENAIGSKTIDGTIVYYPIVDGINVRSGNSSDYDFTRYYPVFKAVTISDNGMEYSYNSTIEIPATVTWISAEIDDGNGASALNDGFGLYNERYLCKIQKKAGDAEKGGTTVVKYSYVALDGNTYYYYVGYKFYDESEGCVTPDTLITLADGSKVRVDSLTGNEELLVWNLETGKYDVAPIVFVDTEEETEYEIIHLYFSDGSDVKVISEHGFFDLDIGKYVYIDALNYEDYIGHRFVAEGSMSVNEWSEVTLDKVVIEKEVTTAWSPVTFEHLCYYTNGVLSMPGGIDGLFNIFEVDTCTMRYDEEQKQNDIEKYGLFTLEDFGGLITEEAFEAFKGAYLKVAIGKGMLTWEDMACLAERYIPLMN